MVNKPYVCVCVSQFIVRNLVPAVIEAMVVGKMTVKLRFLYMGTRKFNKMLLKGNKDKEGGCH